MAKKEIKDIAESIRARLKNIAKNSGRDFDAVLLQYFQERFLYRISISEFSESENLLITSWLISCSIQ